ncbi:ornithine cyclodeaminase family protein [Rhizorhabdus histidinilytica]|jgi:ornithine cyclodeaminase|uniref:Ornithine cyclodeaminase n=1 Tax=Rhizorhabdus histidinilytica TaxID=439228 RepID=A0A1T5FEY6_9SPHN|nr:ornithine cyclodeaminase family protein [Rhizorhabdus histidinilytica]QEH81218.1 ornithine cyclodeaminase family protein [Sphingomonas sp. C8-2]SKB94677.1 ornithine cyclodeaminase [Rhizorhabdus histidinilytica]
MNIAYYDAEQVERLLDYPGCIAAVRQAMRSLSESGKAQPLRQIVRIAEKTMFGVMPGDLAAIGSFGAKLVSVAEDPARPGRSRHRGVVVAYAADSAEVEAIADAEAVTAIRTACATAAATDALARPDARVLAVFGAGTQAETHIRALRHVRDFDRILLWGRSADSTATLAARLSRDLGIAVEATTDGRRAAGEADVICTVSGSAEPILFGAWVREGTHVNLVGSSMLGPVEVDGALVAAGRYIADYRPGALAQASELAVARDAGLVTDDHVVGEIGEVFAGTLAGRESPDQITLYKSLGHVVQDLAATAYLHRRALSEGIAT